MIVNMKKPIINKLVLSFIAFGLLGTLTGCQKGSGPNSPDFAVWTTYSTAKVIEQTYKNDIFINNGASIDIKMMKDEYESSQLIITSKEIIKGPIKQNIFKSNLLNPNRISIVKLKNENISSFPKNSNLQNNQTKSYLPFNMNNSSNGNIINYNFYQINNNRQFNNVLY